MSLLVAVPMGVGSAIAFGAAAAAQHSAAYNGTGHVDPRGLLRLLTSPRWLLAAGGDLFGFILQIIAISNASVVLVQPLLVLMLPVSLFVGAMFGGARPTRGDYLACLSIIGGLTAFFLLIGTPGRGRLPTTSAMTTTVVLAIVIGGGLCLAVRHRSAGVRAGVFGVVAGSWFGMLGAMIDALGEEFSRHGSQGLLTTADGLVPLIGAGLLGGLGLTLTQVAFQIGALSATLPGNLAADPLAAVALGAILLHEHVPGGLTVFAYALCLAAIVAGAVRLAATGPASAVDPATTSTVDPATTASHPPSGTMASDEQSRAR